MATVNIGGDQNDKNFRYKRPRIKNKIEGRGNGIKTVITNMADIAKSLHVDPEYPTKFFGLELGAQSKFDKKRDEAIVNGAHDVPKMETLMDQFIATFVLCPKCKLPEIKMEVKKSIKIKCAACGHSSELQSAHKLVTFILKNPPESGKKGSSKKSGSKKDKKKNGTEENDSPRGDGSSPEEHSDSGSDADKQEDGNEQRPTPSAAPSDKKTSNGSSSSASASGKKAKESDEIEWQSDTSKEAVQLRREREIAEIKNNQKSIDAIVSAAQDGVQKDTPLDCMRSMLAQGKNDLASVTNELRRLQLSRGLSEPQKLQLLLQALIEAPTSKTVASQFKKHVALLAGFAKDEQSMNAIIDALEDFLANNAKLVSCCPKILQVLYDGDVLSEEVLLKWHESPAAASKLANTDVAQAIRDKSTPFIAWLKNAEEEEEADE